jgi:hypothetical protein
VLFPATSQAVIASVRAGGGRSQQFSNPWKAYPP